MDLEFKQDTISGYDTVAEVTLCQEETLESIVPDACPDILRIVDVCGQALLTGKQARDGLACVSGLVRAIILYQPEGEGSLRRMEVSLPFSCQAEAPGLTELGTVQASPRLRFAEARVLNPRKVLLRVDLAVDVTACQPMEMPLCCGVMETDDEICQLQYHGEQYQICSVQEKPFTFREQVRLQGNQNDRPILLASRAQAVCSESKLIGSKLIFKGNVELTALVQESGGVLTSEHEILPFSQVLEIPGAGEDADCQVHVEVTDLQCTLSEGDNRSLDADFELLAQVRVRCRRPITLLRDLYSTSHTMEVDTIRQELCQFRENSVRPQAVRELLETPGMVRSVVDSRLTLGQVRKERDGRELLLTTDVWLAVLYLDEQEDLQCVRKSVNVTCRLEHPDESSCSCQSLGEVFAVPAAGGVEVRFSVEFHCLTTAVEEVACVRSARLGEPRSCGEGGRPSIVLRSVLPGEGLWELAKMYGTTTERILQANELETDVLPEGRMLLIPGRR